MLLLELEPLDELLDPLLLLLFDTDDILVVDKLLVLTDWVLELLEVMELDELLLEVLFDWLDDDLLDDSEDADDKVDAELLLLLTVLVELLEPDELLLNDLLDVDRLDADLLDSELVDGT